MDERSGWRRNAAVSKPEAPAADAVLDTAALLDVTE
jgi:hypothetical protein